MLHTLKNLLLKNSFKCAFEIRWEDIWSSWSKFFVLHGTTFYPCSWTSSGVVHQIRPGRTFSSHFEYCIIVYFVTLPGGGVWSISFVVKPLWDNHVHLWMSRRRNWWSDCFGSRGWSGFFIPSPYMHRNLVYLV